VHGLTQIATDGGLLPAPITRDSFELWPAERREMVIDFTRHLDGTLPTKSDVIYLTNVVKMPDGRMWSNSSRFSSDPRYVIPVLKIVIGDTAPDDSQILPQLRPLPPLPANWRNLLEPADLRGGTGSAGGEIEWLINGKSFDRRRWRRA
jgi:hypothetical protein